MIVCKNPSELEKMRRSGQVLRQVLEEVRRHIAPGVTTMDLERVAEKKIQELGAQPAFKGYNGFPCVLCTSVNQEVIHGIPSEKRRLKDGDIVSIDCGVVIEGFYTDSAFTVAVGSETSSELKKLLEVTEGALQRGMQKVRVGNTVGDIGAAVQQHVESNGFSVVREFVGHGIGTRMHEDPQVPNYGSAGEGIRLREGMVLAIEPMVSVGRPDVQLLDDNWTAVTRDGSYSAHFEHCVAVTRNGPLVLTA